jgi:hypothetical protein
MPGSYDFYAVGALFACSPGPVNLALGSGENDELAWATTTLKIDGLSTGTVWIADKIASGLGSLSTCPTTATVGAIAINVDGARTAPVAIPAGSWYVWQTNGAWNGTCVSYPNLISSFGAPYNTAVLKTWAATPPPTQYSAITMTGITSQRWLVLSTAVTNGTCTTTNVPTTGTKYTSASRTSTNGQSLTIPGGVPRPTTGNTTYFAYLWNNNGSNGAVGCTAVGTYVVGPSTTTLTKPATTGTVGP